MANVLLDSQARGSPTTAPRQAPCTAPENPGWLEIMKKLRGELRESCIDILEPMYNEEVQPDQRIDAAPGRLAVLLGNTRAMWDAFLAACRADARLLQAEHPLDAYVEQRVRAAAGSLGTPVRLFYGHEPGAGGAPRYVALQRAAAAGGLAHLDGSHLCLHHKFGPWFTLRATLVFDAVEYTGPRKPRASNPLPPSTQAYLRMAVRSALGPYAAAVAGGRPPPPEAVRARWRQWVAVRDAPSPGHPWRFSEAQLRYHYTADRAALAAAVAAPPLR